jgi:hypothetical protein
VPPEQLTAQTHDLAQHDLVVLPLDRVRSQGTAYHTVLAGAKPAEPFHWRVVIGSTQNVEEFKAAWDANDQRRVRTLLGYPACCRDFFEEVWVKEKFIDTTWPMACNTQAKKEIDSHIVEVDGPVQANVLLRWLGVRAVSHLPCRFDCPATIEQETNPWQWQEMLDMKRKYPGSSRFWIGQQNGPYCMGLQKSKRPC